MKFSTFSIIVILTLLLSQKTRAQENDFKDNYVGFIPSFLIEPYDSINAIEVNLFPFLYECRIGKYSDIGLQVRPIMNYRFFKAQSGFSQTGATVAANKYFPNLFGDDSWLKPQLAVYYTYTYNLLDKIQTMTLGIEPGIYMEFADKFSMSLNLQPGINYYPDETSQEFVKTKSGFKSHFGVIYHVGLNF